MKMLTPLALVLSAGLALAACDKKDASGGSDTSGASQPTAAAAAPADPAADAKKMFAGECSTCHGADGKGDGPGAAALNPKPRDFADAAWQDKTPDDELSKVIVGGGAAAGMSAAMPPHPTLKKKPEVVAELIKIIRGFKK
ncbi:MAG: c-type cytochrome [Sorangiineae bacterium]|nr:c-type cytochrome [Polyangiaceae bacterium]MEB2322571.1 c-type cytochrome [Sorangiineae bacterium]